MKHDKEKISNIVYQNLKHIRHIDLIYRKHYRSMKDIRWTYKHEAISPTSVPIAKRYLRSLVIGFFLNNCICRQKDLRNIDMYQFRL